MLTIDPKHSKALFRRALAFKGTNDYKEAIKDLRTATHINPSDKTILQELKSLQGIAHKYLSREKVFFSNMFK